MARAKRRKKRIRPNPFSRLLVVLIPVIAIAWGFALPWLDYRCTGFNATILGCPTSEMVPGWRLPMFAHEAEQAWVVRVAQIFSSSDPDRSKAWLVYGSPLAAVLCLLLLQGRYRTRLRLAVAGVNGFILLLLIRRLQEPMPEPPLPGLEVELGIGILLSTVGHALACWAALMAKK